MNVWKWFKQWREKVNADRCVADLKVGEEAYVIPWALTYVNGPARVNKLCTISERPTAYRCLHIKRCLSGIAGSALYVNEASRSSLISAQAHADVLFSTHWPETDCLPVDWSQ